jgi:hypothetical protein
MKKLLTVVAVATLLASPAFAKKHRVPTTSSVQATSQQQQVDPWRNWVEPTPSPY